MLSPRVVSLTRVITELVRQLRLGSAAVGNWSWPTPSWNTENLQLLSIFRTTGRSSFGYAEPCHMIAGETKSCGHVLKYIPVLALVATLRPTACWLLRIRRVAVGIVPDFGVVAVILA
jgi:hypothetical protein